MTHRQDTSASTITPVEIDELFDLLFARVADLIREHVEERLARMESDLTWLVDNVAAEQDLGDTRHARLLDVVLAMSARGAAAPLDVLAQHAERIRHTSASAADLADAVRNACGPLYWPVQSGSIRAERILEQLVDATAGRLDPADVAGIVERCLEHPQGRRSWS